MTRKANLEKAIEVFVVLTLPLALVVGCAGSGNVQPELVVTEDISSIEQSYNMDDIYPLFSNDDDNLQVKGIVAISTTADSTPKVSTAKVFTTTEKDQVAISDSELKASVDKVTGDVLIGGTIEPMMTVSFTDSSTTEQRILMIPADLNADVLVEGANSSLALMNDIEIQPEYLVFNFDSDSVAVHGYDHYFLKQHAGYLKSNPDLILKIRGHTDSRGSRIYNEELSKRRADKVKTLLIAFGAPESQIQMKGLGEIQPVDDESKMQENRRVELSYIDSTMVSAR